MKHASATNQCCRAPKLATMTSLSMYIEVVVARGLAPATLKHHWSTLRAVFVYAQRHNAIASNPVDGVNFSGNNAKRRNKRHHPVTGAQVVAVAEKIGER